VSISAVLDLAAPRKRRGLTTGRGWQDSTAWDGESYLTALVCALERLCVPCGVQLACQVYAGFRGRLRCGAGREVGALRVGRARFLAIAAVISPASCRRYCSIWRSRSAIRMSRARRVAQRVFHSHELRIPGDIGMERGCNVLRCAVNTLHVLQQANRLGDRLSQGMFELHGWPLPLGGLSFEWYRQAKDGGRHCRSYEGIGAASV
jgi:hypothetical protein